MNGLLIAGVLALLWQANEARAESCDDTAARLSRDSSLLVGFGRGGDVAKATAAARADLAQQIRSRVNVGSTTYSDGQNSESSERVRVVASEDLEGVEIAERCVTDSSASVVVSIARSRLREQLERRCSSRIVAAEAKIEIIDSLDGAAKAKLEQTLRSEWSATAIVLGSDIGLCRSLGGCRAGDLDHRVTTITARLVQTEQTLFRYSADNDLAGEPSVRSAIITALEGEGWGVSEEVNGPSGRASVTCSSKANLLKTPGKSASKFFVGVVDCNARMVLEGKLIKALRLKGTASGMSESAATQGANDSIKIYQEK